jgi:hypothetical protein
MASPLGPYLTRSQLAQMHNTEKFPSKKMTHADFGEVRGNVSAGHIIKDLFRAVRGVRCIHNVRISRCLACGIMFEGNLRAMLRNAGVGDREDAIIAIVETEVARVSNKRRG